MRVLDMILQKRNGAAADPQELAALIQAFTKDEIPDYQMAAWLMAVYFQGMTTEETAAMTMAMAHSGDMLKLTEVPGIKIDKHSTGGVADTTTLVLAPLVAAAGIPVAKMSGRGLGFTGGTIDKLEAIPGMRSTLTKDEFIDNLKKHNLAITGQSANIAPADAKMYALRDVTGTVESIPLIAASIMSKKIAAGADKILLDVKVGNGAFMKNLQDAIKLAQTMVHIGDLVGRETMAVLTGMDEPLGQAIGNSLEVQEAIDILSGRGSAALRHVCLALGAYILVMAGTVPHYEAGYQRLTELIDTRQGIEKFREFIAAQGGNPAITEQPGLLPQAGQHIPIHSKKKGYIQRIAAAELGYSAMLLGAGRQFKGQSIDLSTGLVMECRVGDFIELGQRIAVLHVNNSDAVAEVVARVEQAITIGDHPTPQNSLLLGIVDKNGYQESVKSGCC